MSGHGKEALKKVKRKSSLQKKMLKEKMKQNSSNNLLEEHEVEKEKAKKTRKKTDQNMQTKPKTVHFSENTVVSERRRSSLKPVQKNSPESKAVMKTLEKEQRKRKNNGVCKENPPKEKTKGESLSSLNLRLNEVIHIRTQLTNAELENRNISESVKTEVLNARLCFLCTFIKFGVTQWAYSCKICQKSVSIQDAINKTNIKILFLGL